jgi:serine protease AprX
MNKVNELLEIHRLHHRNLTGEGIAIAVLDSGVSNHPDLEGNIIAFQDFVHQRKEAYDDLGHGTHVSGIIAGTGKRSGGKYCGIAPGAKIVSLKILNRYGTGSSDAVLNGIQWVIDNGIRYGIRIVNMSFGAPYKAKREDWQLLQAVEELWNLGYVVVASAGNNGPEFDTISVPGRCDPIITVGASDDGMGGVVNGIYRKHYSGRGKPGLNITKPDIFAPAHQIVSCSNRWKEKQFYISKTGTSMATPIVSGVIALMLQENLRLSNYECKQRIKETATALKGEVGGIINPLGIWEKSQY